MTVFNVVFSKSYSVGAGNEEDAIKWALALFGSDMRNDLSIHDFGVIAEKED